MLILHAGFWEKSLYFWGETSYAKPKAAKRIGNAKPNEFPFDAGQEKIREALSLSEQNVPTKQSTSIVWLPSSENFPLVSSPLISDFPKDLDTMVISPWIVSSVAFSTEAFFPILCSWMDKKILAPGILLGDDIRYWTWAIRFVQSILCKQHFLPSLMKQGEKYHASWKPLFLGEDKQAFAKLAQSMPGICRALTPEGRKEAPCLAASYVLEYFLQQVSDSILRSQEGTAKSVATKSRPVYKFASIHDEWLHALRAPSGEMKSSGEDLQAFAEQLENWQRPVLISADSPFRLCLRLEEPTQTQSHTQSEAWKVQFFLQDVKDPSLLVPTAQAWQAKGMKASFLKRHDFHPKEYLLSAFGEAAKVCPHIEKSLKSSKPEGYELDADEAYDFLLEKAWLLRQMGFGVFLPGWWIGKGTQIRLKAKAVVSSPAMKPKGKFSLDQVVEIHWEIALGEESISLKELQELARLKSSLVQFRGQWIQVDTQEIAEAIQFWQKRDEKITVRDAMQMSLLAQKPTQNLEFGGMESHGWVEDFFAELHSPQSLKKLGAPGGFSGELRPYQVRGYSWLEFLSRCGLGACLADDMGLGKTIQTLALLEYRKEKGEDRPTLLICPTSVTTNWIKEASRFTPKLRTLLHHGIQRKKGKDFLLKTEGCDLVVSSYSLLHRDLDILQKVAWAGVILDEAQNIKNPQTKQSKSSRSLQSDYRLALTGTPVENNVGELWSLMEFLNPGFIGSQSEFKKRFFVPIQFHRDQKAMEDLKRLTGPFVLRRLKTDKSIIQDLPEKIETKVYCKLSKEQASLYEAVLQDTMKKIEETEGIERKGIILSTLMKLKQICNHPAQFLKDNSPIPDRSGKLARLNEILEEILAGDEKALLFTQFVEMGAILKRHIEETFGEEALFLHGQVERAKREKLIESFQKEKQGPRLFILSLKAGGTGLNLTRASHVFHFDRWWNPAVENQATDRAFRIGQTRNVQVHKFLCAGTMEEKIDTMIEDKKGIAENVIGVGESWLTELSTKQLKAIFTLSKEAIGDRE